MCGGCSRRCPIHDDPPCNKKSAEPLRERYWGLPRFWQLHSNALLYFGELRKLKSSSSGVRINLILEAGGNFTLRRPVVNPLFPLGVVGGANSQTQCQTEAVDFRKSLLQ